MYSLGVIQPTDQYYITHFYLCKCDQLQSKFLTQFCGVHCSTLIWRAFKPQNDGFALKLSCFTLPPIHCVFRNVGLMIKRAIPEPWKTDRKHLLFLRKHWSARPISLHHVSCETGKTLLLGINTPSRDKAVGRELSLWCSEVRNGFFISPTSRSHLAVGLCKISDR